MLSVKCYRENHHMCCVLGAPISPFFDVLEMQNTSLCFISSHKIYNISVQGRAFRSPSAK